MSQFYMRKITLTTTRVTIRPGLPRLAVVPFVQFHLHNKYGMLRRFMKIQRNACKHHECVKEGGFDKF